MGKKKLIFLGFSNRKWIKLCLYLFYFMGLSVVTFVVRLTPSGRLCNTTQLGAVRLINSKIEALSL